jgi:hypothetical protein
MTSPTTYKLGFPKLKYSVVPMASGAPFQRDPTTADLFDPKVGGYYNIGTIWPNEATGGVWILASISGGNTANWLGITDAASGNMDGPASSTDKAIVRFNGTTGKLAQNSVGILSDVGILTGVRPTLPAGTAVAGTAPMKFTLGVNLTVAEAGAVEYDGTSLFYTNNAAARQTLLHAPTLSSSVDNTLPKFDGTSWGIQDSGIVVSDTDVMSAFTAVLKAGTAAAGTAPLKFTLGVNLTSPEAGAVEYDGTHLYYTNNAAARQTVGVGPTSSTDNRLARMDGAAGAYQEAIGTTLSDADVMTFPAQGGVVLTSGGAGARKGSVALIGGTANVPTTAAVTGSVIAYSIVALGTVTDPMPMLITINTGVSFDITSEDATDTSTINWAIVG